MRGKFGGMYEYEVREIKVYDGSTTDEARAELEGELNNMAKSGYRLVQIVTLPSGDVFGTYEREKKAPPPPRYIGPAITPVGIKRPR